MGSYYDWNESILQTYQAVYGALTQLENDRFAKAPAGNLPVALRAFMNIHDRWPSFADSQLLDAMTAFEALLAIDSELTFRLAFRVAGLLGASHDERCALLTLMKDFYGVRSTIVHGGTLNAKQRRRLDNFDELHLVLRKLLRSFVSFSANPPRSYTKKFFTQLLDITLVDATERETLRTALGLVANERN
jgi:hypothetical protein